VAYIGREPTINGEIS